MLAFLSQGFIGAYGGHVGAAAAAPTGACRRRTPGASFMAPIQKVEKGRVVTVRKQLWRGSGCMPAIQPRHGVQVPGRRHEQRPSSMAKKALGRGGHAVDHTRAQAYVAAAWSTDAELPVEVSADAVG